MSASVYKFSRNHRCCLRTEVGAIYCSRGNCACFAIFIRRCALAG
jgi:hypothetical protein